MAEESSPKLENSDCKVPHTGSLKTSPTSVPLSLSFAATPYRITSLSGLLLFITSCLVLPLPTVARICYSVFMFFAAAVVFVLLLSIPIVAYMFNMGSSSGDIGAKECECWKEREGDLLNGREAIADAGSIPQEQFPIMPNSMDTVAGTDDDASLHNEAFQKVRRLQVAYNRLCVAKGKIKTMGDEVQFFEAVLDTRELLQNALSSVSRETLREVFGGEGNAFLHEIRRVLTKPPLSHSDMTEANKRSIDLANCLSACESVEKVLDDLGSFRPFQQDGSLTGDGEIALPTRSRIGFPCTAVLTPSFAEYSDADVPSLESGKQIEECKVAEAFPPSEEERLIAERVVAEERRLAKEAALRDEEERNFAEALAKAEEDRLAEERAIAEERRLAEEAALRDEEERKAAEALAKAEEDRLAKERTVAEERRLAKEAALRDEEERKIAEALAKAEEDRLNEERAVAEEKRLAEEEAEEEKTILLDEEEGKVALAEVAAERHLPEGAVLQKITNERAKVEQDRNQEDVGGRWEERITERTIDVWVPDVQEVRRTKATVLGVVAEPIGQHAPTIPCNARLLGRDSVLQATPQNQTLSPSKSSACRFTSDGFCMAPKTVIAKERSASTCETGHWEQRKEIEKKMVWVPGSR